MIEMTTYRVEKQPLQANRIHDNFYNAGHIYEQNCEAAQIKLACYMKSKGSSFEIGK